MLSIQGSQLVWISGEKVRTQVYILQQGATTHGPSTSRDQIFGNRESDKFPFALPHWDGSHPAISIVEPRITRTVQAGLKGHAHLATRLFAMPDAADSITTDALARGKKLN